METWQFVVICYASLSTEPSVFLTRPGTVTLQWILYLFKGQNKIKKNAYEAGQTMFIGVTCSAISAKPLWLNWSNSTKIKGPLEMIQTLNMNVTSKTFLRHVHHMHLSITKDGQVSYSLRSFYILNPLKGQLAQGFPENNRCRYFQAGLPKS